MRKALAALTVPGAVAAGVLALVPGAGARHRVPGATVHIQDCHSAALQLDRSVDFAADQPAVAGAERMAVRLDLYERRRRHRHYRRVRAPQLGVWHISDPGVPRYIYRQRVTNLVAPARYRVRARFRWLDADGHVVEHARDTTRACRQRDVRADLHVRWVHREDGRYLVEVENRGLTSSGPTAVTLRVGELDLPPAEVPGLDPGERATVPVDGPPCAEGGALHVSLDPADQVDEARERDDDRTLDCPR